MADLIHQKQALTAFMLNDFLEKSSMLAAMELSIIQFITPYYALTNSTQPIELLCPQSELCARLSPSTTVVLIELLTINQLYSFKLQFHYFEGNTRWTIFRSPEETAPTISCTVDTGMSRLNPNRSPTFLPMQTAQTEQLFQVALCVGGVYCVSMWKGAPDEWVMGAEETLYFRAQSFTGAIEWVAGSPVVDFPFATLSSQYTQTEGPFDSVTSISTRFVNTTLQRSSATLSLLLDAVVAHRRRR